MSAYLIVRAEVADAAVRSEFDRWYQAEHLPDAFKGFNARSAWRGWSTVDPLVHYAYYEFADASQAQAIRGSEILSSLVAEFDRVWGDKVVRTRDYVEVVQALGR